MKSIGGDPVILICFPGVVGLRLAHLGGAGKIDWSIQAVTIGFHRIWR